MLDLLGEVGVVVVGEWQGTSKPLLYIIHMHVASRGRHSNIMLCSVLVRHTGYVSI